MRVAAYLMRIGRGGPLYSVTDRLHDGRTVQVPGRDIAPTVSAWLAELGAHSPLVDDLAQAVCVGDWAVAYAVADQLSVDVAVAQSPFA
ncbi:hypothetical protein [Mycobacterium sp. 852002-51057_SCH5723018]|uniref:hypothetical protein n=1 Tax=Mycobacterium sp. 852002-51057_SCH5723018 TaxID=1834094 RepID=UPI0007FBF9C1|nr:hypothetical protein [Mycobacterium sp. 852002-51057_SCH5723018]OBG29607.1 hypothetical protein A5764_21700 [Mycobacterium sp. 852002-51057_SCH5723018]